MIFKKTIAKLLALLLVAVLFTLSACLPEDMLSVPAVGQVKASPTPSPVATETISQSPTRPPYQPGELVDYIAQSGDTLPAIAAHFNTTVKEIRAANTFIPGDATTMPPGMPMKIPIYYNALWGSSYQIIPDAHFVNGPAAKDFDPVEFVRKQPGWLKNYTAYAGDQNRDGGEIVAFVAMNYSINPRLLLALLEYQLKALSDPEIPESASAGYPLGEQNTSATGLYRQLAWAANFLNNNYYTWRAGALDEYLLADGELVRPDPWQNAATVALQIYFSHHHDANDYRRAISETGLAATFRKLFGDPWLASPPIPGSLRQPFFRLPFLPGYLWALTGGPHNPWGSDMPLAALDFAPPLVVGGCTDTDQFATAVADGVVARTGVGIVVLDLDGDMDERTGWVVFYLHLKDNDRVPVGKKVKAGDPLGHPSCEGGEATGTHQHIARKYNGEWVLADGAVPFAFEGWITHSGSAAYYGYMDRNGHKVTACTCSDKNSQLQSEFK